MRATGFDRIRARTDAAPPARRDPLGRAALYSSTPQPSRRPAPFSALLDCSGCGASSAATLGRAVAQSVPGLHVPWLRRDHGSFMRCPACRRFRWMSVRIALR